MEILFKENEHVKVKIKTPYESDDKKNPGNELELDNTVLQGTIFSGLKCTASLDKLGKQSYHEGKPLYVYKNTVLRKEMSSNARWKK